VTVLHALWSKTWFRALVVLAVFLLAIAVTYNYVLFCNKANLAGRYDVYRAVGPFAYYVDYTIHHGEFPLWNPLTYCGMPCAANPIAAVFYPLNLLRSVASFHPTPLKAQVGWMVLMAAHLLIAAAGIFLLARRHGQSPCAACAAAFVFIFSAIWIRRICEYHFIAMVGWLPLMLLLALEAGASGNWRSKLGFGMLGGGIFGATILTGFVNIVAYMSVAVIGFSVFYRLTRLSRVEIKQPSVLARTLGGDALFGVAFFGIAVLIALPLLLPGSELAAFSTRVKGTEYELASPRYGGSPLDLYHTLIRFAGLQWEPENIRGAGITALLLALMGLTHGRKRDVALYAALFWILFDCSMGAPFPLATIVQKLSPFQMVSSTRAFDLALLPLALLAGFGVDAASVLVKPKWLNVVRSCMIGAIGVVMLISLARMMGPGDYMPVMTLSVAIPAISLGVIAAGGWLPFPRITPLVLAILLFAETLSWNVRYVPWLVTHANFAKWAGVYTGEDPFWPDNHRGADPIPNRHLYALRPAINGYEPVHIGRVRQIVASAPRAQTYHRLVTAEEAMQENLRGNLFLKRSFWLARQYVDGPLPDRDVPFPAATTVFLRDPPNLPVPRIKLNDLPHRSISENAREIRFVDAQQLAGLPNRFDSNKKKLTVTLPPVALPGLHSAMIVRYTSTCTAVVKTTFGDPATKRWEYGKTYGIRPTKEAQPITLEIPLPDFDNLTAAFTFEIRGSPGTIQLADAYVLADEADEDTHIRIVSRRANSVSVNVQDLPGYRILTFLDAAYPGWSASVDGEPAPIYLANDAFKAIVVPPGTHQVEFTFRSWRVTVGVAIAVLTAVGVGVSLGILRPMRSSRAVAAAAG